MIPVKHIDPEDLPLYAMQLLPSEEMEEMSLHLQHSVEARRVLSEVYGDLSLFAHTAEMHSPPALARQRLMKNVAREKKVVPAHLVVQAPTDAYAPRATPFLVEDQPVRRSFVARTLPWVGWAVAAGLGLFAVNLREQDGRLQSTVTADHKELAQNRVALDNAALVLETLKDPTALHVTLTSADAKPVPTGRVNYVQDKGSLVFIASNLEPLQPYKIYELWLIPADGRDAVPAGTFKPDEHGNATVVMPEMAKGVVAKAFGVTIEDGDGSSSPTMPIILKQQAG